ncbi:MAG: hypothetical protein HC896_13910 [Bacteroidales bacterium]|nr:hypothetical protein [Bacteroidales bacterium]
MNGCMPLLTYLVIFMSACAPKSEFEGYTRTKSGIHYKLTEIGDAEKNVAPGDYITIDVTYKTLNDSVFFEGRRKIQVEPPSYPGSIDECFLMLAEGDKSTFILEAYPFFAITLNSSLPSFLDSIDRFKVDIKCITIQNQPEYHKEMEAFLSWAKDIGEYEKVVLKQYLKEEKLNIEPTPEGLYKIVIKEGAGEKVKTGDTVVIHYEGKFLNGRYFDSTLKRKKAFGFIYGTEWQVIEGMEKAIGTMKKGETSIFIFPSKLAFGTKGSSTRHCAPIYIGYL